MKYNIQIISDDYKVFNTLCFQNLLEFFCICLSLVQFHCFVQQKTIGVPLVFEVIYRKFIMTFEIIWFKIC